MRVCCGAGSILYTLNPSSLVSITTLQDATVSVCRRENSPERLKTGNLLRVTEAALRNQDLNPGLSNSKVHTPSSTTHCLQCENAFFMDRELGVCSLHKILAEWLYKCMQRKKDWKEILQNNTQWLYPNGIISTLKFPHRKIWQTDRKVHRT
jgi:hypothetical protein